MPRTIHLTFDPTADIGQRRGKFLNRKTVVDDFAFDSQAEADYYGELRLRERAGEVCEIEVHPRFDLMVNGARVARYTADFRYLDVATGQRVVVDIKSPRTRRTADYRLRVRLLKATRGIDVTEVMA